MCKIRHYVWLLILISASTEVPAQIGLDVWLSMAETAEPGQPIVKDGSKFVLYRRNAGTQGPDGWFLASSTDGDFDVQFPAPMIDATVFRRAPTGLSFTQGFLTVQTETTRYVTACTKNTSVTLSAEQVPEWVQQMNGELSDLESAPFSRGKIKGIRYSGVRRGNVYIRGEIFVLNSHRMCVTMVGSVGYFPEDAQRAFESFRPTFTAAGTQGSAMSAPANTTPRLAKGTRKRTSSDRGEQ